jgi:hypothetical protein
MNVYCVKKTPKPAMKAKNYRLNAQLDIMVLSVNYVIGRMFNFMEENRSSTAKSAQVMMQTNGPIFCSLWSRWLIFLFNLPWHLTQIDSYVWSILYAILECFRWEYLGCFQRTCILERWSFIYRSLVCLTSSNLTVN